MTTSAGGAVVNDGHVAIPSWEGEATRLDVPELQARYLGGRQAHGLDQQPYIIWKFREAPKSRIPLSRAIGYLYVYLDFKLRIADDSSEARGVDRQTADRRGSVPNRDSPKAAAAGSD